MGSRKNRDPARQAKINSRKARRRAHLQTPATHVGPTSRRYSNDEKPGPATNEARYAALSRKNKTLLLTDHFSEAFGVKVDGTRIEITKSPPPSEIRRLCELVMNMWPKDWCERRPARTDGFNVLLWANHTPSTVSRAITRCSLYADKILICNPCTNIFLYHPQRSPLVEPEPWGSDYALSALFLVMLRPWVEADIVELFENPLSFDVELFQPFRLAMYEQLVKKPELGKLLDDVEAQEWLVAEQLIQVPEDDWAKIASLASDDPASRDRILQRAQQLAGEDPIRAAIPRTISRGTRQILSAGNGLSYAQAVVMGSGLGANLVAHGRHERRILETDGEQLSGVFQQAAHALGTVPLSFLNNVSSEFAIDMRRDGKLGDFRQYISGVARSIQFKDADKGIAAREFHDRFEAEYRRYQSDWGDIQKKLTSSAVGGIVGGAGAITAAFVSGNLAVLGTLATVAGASIQNLINAVFERRKLDRQPLGVVMRLENTDR